MFRSFVLTAVLLAPILSSLGLTACSSSGSNAPGDGDGDGDESPALTVCKDLGDAAGLVVGEPIDAAASSTPERISTLGSATWPLALEMLRVVEPSKQANLAHSPTSMFAALGMNYGRYETGECGTRIVDVMGFTETGSDLHNTLGSALLELESRSFPESEHSGGLAITLRQSVWTFRANEPPPSTQLQAYYGARQFALGPPNEAARQFLNCFIEEESKGLLKDFFPQGKPQGDTATYDINVSVLAGAWDTAMASRTLAFTAASGSTERDAFGADASGAYFEGDSFASFDLPLAGGDVSVLFVLPHEQDPALLDSFADALNAEDLQLARQQQATVLVDFAMPKLAVSADTIDYNPLLGFECPEFTLRDVLHNAVVEFDEKGIKAAAATAAETWEDGGGPPEPAETFHLTRPFLFFVYDHETDFVLFSGRYLGD
jgi:serine protease inhibitor